MQTLETTLQTTGTIHHAYFLLGNPTDAMSELISFLEKSLELKISGNPDFWYKNFDNFTVDDARLLVDNQERKSFVSAEGGLLQKKVFVIQANFITEQAQNALLKIFEEPTKHTYFFLLMPQDTILPTLRSRLEIITIAEGGLLQSSDTEGFAEDRLLQKTLGEKMAMVKKITDGIKDEEKTKQDAINLLNQTEQEICRRPPSAEGGPLQEQKGEILKICQLTREALNDNGAPIKMILENLMLNL